MSIHPQQMQNWSLFAKCLHNVSPVITLQSNVHFYSRLYQTCESINNFSFNTSSGCHNIIATSEHCKHLAAYMTLKQSQIDVVTSITWQVFFPSVETSLLYFWVNWCWWQSCLSTHGAHLAPGRWGGGAVKITLTCQDLCHKDFFRPTKFAFRGIFHTKFTQVRVSAGVSQSKPTFPPLPAFRPFSHFISAYITTPENLFSHNRGEQL